MTDSERPGTRGQEHEIAIDASAEAVWRAISEADEVVRWYVQSAEIDGREGGLYRVSWGEGMDGTSRIEAFEPGRRLRLAHEPMPGSPEIETGPIVDEWVIATEGGRTVLRLVTSGIPETEDWDWFYEGTKRGWTIFLLTLKQYLEHHAGTPREHVVHMVGLPGEIETHWPWLVGPEGLGFETPPEDIGTGGAYRATTAFGLALEGELLLVDAPFRLLCTVADLNQALLGLTLEEMGGQNFLYLSLSIFGFEDDRVAAIREHWGAWIKGLYPDAMPADQACVPPESAVDAAGGTAAADEASAGTGEIGSGAA